ncbi:RNA-guided endonuclease InsQ/TnpB family protein [Streptomyces sp. NPDC059957]|uniref:RNA-guided endonuclease InsQ/TnpB family protein n=1 Tax=unclassified Streptomyces TaxID=2593676 RepID=UPI00365EDD84
MRVVATHSVQDVGDSSVKRAFKYRFYPNDTQAAELSRTFGCVRKVYNLALAARTEAWATGRERVGVGQTSAMLTAWKKTADLAYLTEVSSVPLQQTLRHLHAAFVGFWAKRSRYPHFKSKRRARQSAEYTRSAFRYADGRLTLAKMAAPLAIVWSRPLPAGAVPSTVTVSRDGAHRWFVSLLCEDTPVSMPDTTHAIGIDAGLTALVTLSTGEKVRNPKHERKERERLARAQRALSRKEQGSNNRAKARTRVARVREWTCETCGTTHDRDGNAAINLLAAGLAVTACGTDVGPQRETSSRPGRSVVKQETPRARVGTPSR